MNGVRIFKFTLQPEVNVIPGIVRVLGVGWQSVEQESEYGLIRGHELRLWAEVDLADPTPSKFYAAITGQSPPPDAEFIGTAVGPMYVSHVYREVPS